MINKWDIGMLRPASHLYVADLCDEGLQVPGLHAILQGRRGKDQDETDYAFHGLKRPKKGKHTD
jgi:hypothetical protein